MDCRNCGAPMQLFDRRRYYFCGFCGTFSFIESPAIDGLRVLEKSSGGRSCPLCNLSLAKSLLDDEFAVEHCERCRGLLMPRRTFAEAVTRRRARRSGEPAAPIPLDRRELDRNVHCPSCQQQMDVHPYYGPGNVVIDNCVPCDLIWLDSGELGQITKAGGR